MINNHKSYAPIRAILSEVYKAALSNPTATQESANNLVKSMSPFLLSSSVAIANGSDSVRFNFFGSARSNALDQPVISQNDVFIGVYQAFQTKLAQTGVLDNDVSQLAAGNAAVKYFYQGQMEAKAGNATIFEGLDTQVLESAFDHDGIIEAGDAFREMAVPFVISGEGELTTRIDLPSYATKTFSVEVDSAVPAANQMYLVHQFWGLRVRNFTYSAGVKNWTTIQDFLNAVASM